MVLRLLRKLEPPHGYLVLGLLLGTVLCLPLGVMAAGWLSGSAALLGIALLAALTGFVAGLTPVPGWLVGLFGLLTGIEWSVATLGRLLPSAGAIARELGRSALWLWSGLHGAWTADWPLLSLLPDVRARGLALWARLGSWAQAGLSGGASHDSLVLLMLAAVATWWLGYFAGWQVARRRSALVALAPAGAALLANCALTWGAGVDYLRAFLGGTLLLMVLLHFHSQEARWQREAIDYSEELRPMVGLVGLALSSLLVVVALAMPYVTWRQSVDLFWRYAHRPYEAVTQRLDRLFAARIPVAGPAPAGRHGAQGHELSGPVELGRDLVFYVATSDPAPPPSEEQRLAGAATPQHYWRELTYDTYTGRGWENATSERMGRAAGDELAAPPGPHTILTQTFTLQQPAQGLAPAANEPVRALVACTLIRRSPSDLVGLAVEATEYTIVSHIPSPTVEQLRQAGAEYPAEIAARYLSLPAIPERVLDLARRLTARAPTPYDKAVAIEGYLRAFDYDLEIAAPPAGADVADYLLFETRRGYCDYYATAMAVMLRAVGVPARYAAGFAMGQYDERRGAYAVTQRDSHAWVEVYFPGCGWIEFEPTPYRAAFARPADNRAPPTSAATPLPAAMPWATHTLAGAVLLLAAAALGGLLCWALRALQVRRNADAARLAQQIYGEMLAAARRVGLEPAAGDTVLEFSDRLGRALEARGQWARGAAAEAQAIARAYVLARYGSAPPSASEAGTALIAWQRLRGRLRRLFWWRW